MALFGATGAFVPGLAVLTVVYRANRFAGSASWRGMVSIVPDWFARPRWPLGFAILSLSFVFGGALAVAFAGLVAKLSHDNWRLILGTPSVALLGLAVEVRGRGCAGTVGGLVDGTGEAAGGWSGSCFRHRFNRSGDPLGFQTVAALRLFPRGRRFSCILGKAAGHLRPEGMSKHHRPEPMAT